MGARGIDRFRNAGGLLLLPFVVGTGAIAFTVPEITEAFYARGAYPFVARAFALLNPFAFL